VSGKVIYKGQPVEGAIVTFMSEGASRTATGMTDAQGAFKLTTYDTDDGAIVGKHAVSISKATPASSAPTPATAENLASATASGEGISQFVPEQVLPAKYADPKLSGLTREVVAGDTNDFTFDLKD
jgi:hypothetical protein